MTAGFLSRLILLLNIALRSVVADGPDVLINEVLVASASTRLHQQFVVD